MSASPNPMPPRVHDHYAYWTDPPPELSARCRAWADRIEQGWRRNKRVGSMGYDQSAEHFGVYIWEYLNVIQPLLWGKDA